MDERDDELIPTRATLIERLKDWQDQASWQVFFDTYWQLIYGVAIKRGLTRPEAQDVVQEVLVSAAKHMPGFKYDPAIGSFKAWLLKMTGWRIADQIRKRHPHNPPRETMPRLPLEESKADPDTHPAVSPFEKLWDEEWERNLLNLAILKARRRLNPRQYQIFDFCVNKQWDPERIAKMFAVPVGQVYVAKHRVTETIKEEVERLKAEIV